MYSIVCTDLIYTCMYMYSSYIHGAKPSQTVSIITIIYTTSYNIPVWIIHVYST